MAELEVQQAAQERATPEDYKSVFEGTSAGQKVLEDLLGRFHDAPVYVPGGIEAQRETEARAARKSVIEWILNRLAQPERERTGAG